MNPQPNWIERAADDIRANWLEWEGQAEQLSQVEQDSRASEEFLHTMLVATITNASKEDFAKMRLAAQDLFMLCRRASVSLDRKYHDTDNAIDILRHASGIAGKVGIKERDMLDEEHDRRAGKDGAK